MNDEALEIVLEAAKKIRVMNRNNPDPALASLSVDLYTDALAYMEQCEAEEYETELVDACECQCGCDEVDIVGELIEKVAELNSTVDGLVEQVKNLNKPTVINVALKDYNILDLIGPNRRSDIEKSRALLSYDVFGFRF